MKFSVVVPTYDEKDCISECLRSIHDQDYPRDEFEIIVSDATSSDGTAAIARPLADKVVVTGKRGIAHGRNFGAQHARGDILVFADADVVLHKEFLKEVESAFRGQKVVGVTGVGIPGDGGWFQRAVYRGTYVLVRAFDFFGMPFYPGLCVAYKRDAFERVGGFREDFGIVEDLDLTKRISALGKCMVKPTATARVSTRRIQKHALSTICFHIYSDLRYLFTGRAAKIYPKVEELNSPLDLWRVNKS
ncbi:MAG: glycosyltransferase [Ignavibacteriales bacterium]|nr:glycosyltransferase [Ignavibacteriales bacterium]